MEYKRRRQPEPQTKVQAKGDISSRYHKRRSKRKKSFLRLGMALCLFSCAMYQYGVGLQKSLLKSTTMSLKEEEPKGTGTNHRKFISYTSSAWEQLWLENVDEWTQQKRICEEFLEPGLNQKYMMEFIDLLCTSRLSPPNQDWCIIDDEYRPLFFNTKNRTGYDLFFHSESPFKDIKLETLKSDTSTHNPQPPRPIRPDKRHEHLVSKFVFEDETTGQQYVEYIEPLVSHLRFPLAKCLPSKIWPIPYSLFRGYVIPIPQLPSGMDKAVYFDAGASSWSQGGGGPSLKYFVEIWKRYGIAFQDIFAYEMRTSFEDFYKTVPAEYKKLTHYQQCAVSSSPETKTIDNPFIPHEIENYYSKQTTSTDSDNSSSNSLYVLYKLDIDSPLVEQGSIDYLLGNTTNNNNNNNNLMVHELAWEHHVMGNYLMKGPWAGPAGMAPLSLKQSYDIFLRLRQLGIRAHSWV